MKPPSPIGSAKAALQERMRRLGVREDDLTERFARASGPGGQHVNKVSTAVTLTDSRSGITVIAQDSRSQAMNRQLARTRLLDAVEEAQRAARQNRQAERAKLRAQNAKRPRGVKERMLEGKRRRTAVKKQRSKVEE